MKLSLALGPRQTPSRQTAWGCLTTNLAVPGFGSLIAGRAVGYFQAAFTFIGLGVTAMCGIGTIIWFLSNWNRLQQPQDDLGAYFQELWWHLRWPLSGMGIFLFAMLWALATSLGILAEARAGERAALLSLPPKI